MNTYFAATDSPVPPSPERVREQLGWRLVPHNRITS